MNCNANKPVLKWEIVPLKTYPDNGKHLEVEFEHFVPFRIVKGADLSKNKSRWEIWTNTKRTICDVQDVSYFIKIRYPDKTYMTPDKAIKIAIRAYRKWLKTQLKEIHGKLY